MSSQDAHPLTLLSHKHCRREGKTVLEFDYPVPVDRRPAPNALDSLVLFLPLITAQYFRWKWLQFLRLIGNKDVGAAIDLELDAMSEIERPEQSLQAGVVAGARGGESEPGAPLNGAPAQETPATSTVSKPPTTLIGTPPQGIEFGQDLAHQHHHNGRHQEHTHLATLPHAMAVGDSEGVPHEPASGGQGAGMGMGEGGVFGLSKRVAEAMEIKALLSQNTDEVDNLVRALDGSYVKPGVGGR